MLILEISLIPPGNPERVTGKVCLRPKIHRSSLMTLKAAFLAKLAGLGHDISDNRPITEGEIAELDSRMQQAAILRNLPFPPRLSTIAPAPTQPLTQITSFIATGVPPHGSKARLEECFQRAGLRHRLQAKIIKTSYAKAYPNTLF